MSRSAVGAGTTATPRPAATRVTSVEVSETSWRTRGTYPASAHAAASTAPITERPCPAWAMKSSPRRSPIRSWSRLARGWSAGSAAINRSRRSSSHRILLSSTGGRKRAMSTSPASSASSCAGASISPRTLISTWGSSSRNARTRRGSKEYVADPTHPMVSWPSTPSAIRRACCPASSTASRTATARFRYAWPAGVSSTFRVLL